MDLPEISNYRELFLKDAPLLDVRAPVEFNEGAFPAAENMPLLNDEERHLIGIRYKNNGQNAAIALGKELIDGQPKAKRVSRWKSFVEKHPEGVLYCFRGGMRSKIAQQWIYETTGIIYPRVSGGYKKLRNFLLHEIDASAEHIHPIIIGGRTGAGKTLILHKISSCIDLEGLAQHRGSAFGHHPTPQPTQINFENRLAIELIKHQASDRKHLILEDESRAIGSRHLPPKLYERMAQSPLVILEASLQERIENSVQEYVINSLTQYQTVYGEHAGMDYWSEYAINSLAKIKKRLGGVRFKAMHNQLKSAIIAFKKDGSLDMYREWIGSLLEEYYDPMYDYQISKKSDRIIFSGDKNAVLEYLNNLI